MMNKKGQSLGLAILSAIVLIVVGFMILNFIMPEISTSRIDLNCGDPDAITSGTKLVCLVGDIIVPYWILLVLMVAIGGITARLFL